VSQPKDSTEFTVRFTKAAYLVLDPAGIEVERYPFDLADFPARRAAYREAMADAEVRTTVAARAVNWGSRPALSLDERMAEKRHQLAALAAQTEGQRPHDFTGVAL
jgi:hypothetical protein